MNKIKVLALVGPSGSGKDTILRKIVSMDSLEKYVSKVVRYTTRPLRNYEKEGFDYHTLSMDEFSKMVLDLDFLECEVVDTGWGYGTTLDSLNKDKINIGCYSPECIYNLIEKSDLIDLKVYYIIVNDKERIIRSLNREEEPSVEEVFRRYNSDKRDFFEFENSSEIPKEKVTLIHNNNKKELKENISKIRKEIVDWSKKDN